jgi:hypothetical protein
MPKSPAVVLYDQYNNAGTIATLSTEFLDIPDWTAFTADDFVVPGGEVWQITEVDAQGIFSQGNGPADSFNVFFYRNNGLGLPGTQVYSATGLAYTGTTDFVIPLTVPATLSPGAYWVSVQAHMNIDPNGDWLWTDRAVQSNNAAAWQEPGGASGGGCLTWSERTSCVGDPEAPDQVFRLIGTDRRF